MKRSVDNYFQENKPHSGLGKTSLRSGVTFVAVRGVNVFVQLASTVLLARLLSPHDFGLVAMMLALQGLAPMLIDLGTSDASTQKTHISHVEVSALFWLNVAIGVALTALLVAGSGLIARIFGEPSLTAIALVLSVTFVMTAAGTQHYALMRRAMQFHRLAMIDISANMAGSIVAVAMAFADWGYWSLVAKPIVTAGVTAVGAWMSCRWVPGRPRFTADVKELVRFGMGVTGFTVTDYLSRSIDRLALGYYYGAAPLGYFQNAFIIYSNLLSILADPLHNIAVSSLSKLRRDADLLKRSWARALSLLIFFSVPAFAALAVIGQDVVVILLGQKWAPAGSLLCIFAVRGIANISERTVGWLHVAAGRSDRWMRWGGFSAICQLVALVAGLPFGTMGVATTYTIVMFGLFIPGLVYAGRPFGIGIRDILRAIGPQTAAALIAVTLGFAVQEMFLGELSRLMRVFVSVSICLGTYFTIVIVVFKVTEPLQLALSVLHDFSPMRYRATPDTRA